MTPTLPIDTIFKGVGRIKLRSGVRDPRLRARMIERFKALCEHEKGRELVRAMKRGELKPRELYELAKRDEHLPAVGETRALAPLWLRWVSESKYSPDHTRNLKKELRRFERTHPGLTVRDLPGVIETLREEMTDRARSFNYARAAALAFLRAKLKRSSPLYVAVWGTDPLKVTPTRKAPDLSIMDVERFGHEAVEMAHTGMLPKEYWGRVFSSSGSVLTIRGTKRAGRDRKIPLLIPITGPKVSLMTFRRRVRKLSDLAVQAKDFRNVFAWLLEESEIPRTRRRLYMGHGKRDTTDIYEEREVRRFLVEDGAKIRATLDRTRAGHTLSHTPPAAGRAGGATLKRA